MNAIDKWILRIHVNYFSRDVDSIHFQVLKSSLFDRDIQYLESYGNLWTESWKTNNNFVNVLAVLLLDFYSLF